MPLRNWRVYVVVANSDGEEHEFAENIQADLDTNAGKAEAVNTLQKLAADFFDEKSEFTDLPWTY